MCNKNTAAILLISTVILFSFSSCKKKISNNYSELAKVITQEEKPIIESQSKPNITTKDLKKSELIQKLEKKSPDDFFVRILLGKGNEISNILKIESSEGMLVFAKPNHKNPILLYSPIFISKHNNKLHLAYDKIKQTDADEIIIKPIKNNSLLLNETSYQGMLSIKFDKNRNLLVINTLSLDDYIYSVLRYEIIQSWDMEMQKVQAIASRTYALYHTLETQAKKRLYDLKNTNSHQTYKGHHEYAHLRKAVEETKNLVLIYDDKPALTMFDACCGGIVPKHMKTPLFDNAPYLARENMCNFCSKCSIYSWKHKIDAAEFLKKAEANKIIDNIHGSIGNFKDIKIIKKDKAGIVHNVEIQGTKRSINIPGNKFISMLKPGIKSKNFKIQATKHPKSGHVINIEGNGYGHQIGLCQYGARALVKQGWDYEKILKFYYPGTRLVKFFKLDKD